MKGMDMKSRIELELRGKDPHTIKELNLDSCRGQQIDGLTDEFTQLENLSLINVGLTTLKGFPKLTNLKKLELSDNRIISGIDNLVAACPSLTHLNLSGNKIKDFDTLAPLGQLANLRNIDLFNCEVTNLQGYREKIFKMLPKLKFLDGFDQNEQEEDDDEDGCSDGEEDEDEEDESYDEENGEGEYEGGEVENDDEDDEDDDGDDDDVDEDEEDEEEDEEATTVKLSNGKQQQQVNGQGEEEEEYEEDEALVRESGGKTAGGKFGESKLIAANNVANAGEEDDDEDDEDEDEEEEEEEENEVGLSYLQKDNLEDDDDDEDFDEEKALRNAANNTTVEDEEDEDDDEIEQEEIDANSADLAADDSNSRTGRKRKHEDTGDEDSKTQ